MKQAVIGASGFVGSNLLLQNPGSMSFHSRNIEEIRGQHFAQIFCAGIQAKKWWANENSDADLAAIERLLANLRDVICDHFVLISTVDVYPKPLRVDEESQFDPVKNHAYGRNRFLAEEFVRDQFPSSLVLRLPGLFGQGLKKNVIHDLIHSHELEKINPSGCYQYYDLAQLSADIARAKKLDLKLLNVATEPIETEEIRARFFPEKTCGQSAPFIASYDMRSRYSSFWESSAPGYLYNKATVLSQLQAYLRNK